MRPAQRPLICEACPAFAWGVGFVKPEVPVRQTDQIVVGQGPGETEARFSRPFHPEAPSGSTLRGWLNKAGLQCTRTLFTNLVWCWLPKDKPKGMPRGSRDPKPAESRYCRAAHLDPLLEQYPDTLRILVGAPATRSLLDVETVSKYVGTFVWRDS